MVYKKLLFLIQQLIIMIGICSSFRLTINKYNFKTNRIRNFKRLSHSIMKMSSSTNNNNNNNNILKEAQTASLEKYFPFMTS